MTDSPQQASDYESAIRKKAERDGAYKFYEALVERSRSACRTCEPKLSTYQIAEEFDRLFPPDTLEPSQVAVGSRRRINEYLLD